MLEQNRPIPRFSCPKMSMESLERVVTNGQVLLEHVIALERALSRDQEPLPELPGWTVRDLRPPSPQAPPAPAVTAVSGACPSGNTSYATMSNYKLTSQWASKLNDRLNCQHNLPTAARLFGSNKCQHEGLAGSMNNWH